MSHPAPAETAGDQPRLGHPTDFLPLGLAFWRGEGARTAWLLTAALLALILVNVAVQVSINRWQATFFNALERRDASAVVAGIGLILVLAAAAALVIGLTTWTRMRLQVAWRAWLTRRLVGDWLNRQRFYRLTVIAPNLDAPEFRIADDVRLAVDPLVDFATGLTNAVLSAAAFITILWTVGGPGEVLGMTIPGYMVWLAVAYALVASGTIAVFGQPLIARVERKNAAEAALRTDLVHVRENAEQIALVRGEADETAALGTAIGQLVARWKKVATQMGIIQVFINANVTLMPTIPLLACAPAYLSGSLTLGSLMQIATAFVQAQFAFNWFFDNYVRIAEWAASASRVTGLTEAMNDLDRSVADPDKGGITVTARQDGAIVLRDVVVQQADGDVMIDDTDVTIAAGEKVLLTGASGSGKSTLVRVIAGLWPWGSGAVEMPKDVRAAFMPQRPYLPEGTLRDCLLYPDGDATIPDETLAGALTTMGLGHFVPRLGEAARWDRTLSAGEQQQLAFARLIVQKPSLVVMDEATSALDEATQAAAMRVFETILPGTTVISVAHRKELEAFHSRKLTLARRDTGSQLVSTRLRRRGRAIAAADALNALHASLKGTSGRW